MKQDEYEYLRQLLRPLESDSFDQKLVDKDRLSDAVGHPNEDIRTASLYLMDQLMEVDEGSVEAILAPAIQDRRNPFRVRTAAQFLAHSRFRDTPKLVGLRPRLVERLPEIMDEETQRLITLITAQGR